MSQVEKDAEEAAREKGLVVRRPTAHQLFIDIDSEADAACFRGAIAALRAELPGDDWVDAWAPSPSGEPHFHVVVDVGRDLDPVERIALQAFLGSDRRRELLSYVRLKTGRRPPEDVTVFFEKPEAPP